MGRTLQVLEGRKMLPSEYIKRGFCTNVMARDSKGKGINADNQNAVSWCLVGAYNAWVENLPKEQYDALGLKFWRRLKFYAMSLGYESISEFSDRLGKTFAIEAAMNAEKKFEITE